MGKEESNMEKHVSALGEIISSKPSKKYTKLTVKNNYSKCTYQIDVPKYIYNQIVEAQKAGAKEFYITYYKNYVSSSNNIVIVALDIICGIHAAKNLSMHCSHLEGTGKLVDDYIAEQSRNN